MSVFRKITATAASIAAGYYTITRIADALPERIEAFQEGDYATAFLGKTLGGFFKSEDEASSETEVAEATEDNTEQSVNDESTTTRDADLQAETEALSDIESQSSDSFEYES